MLLGLGLIDECDNHNAVSRTDLLMVATLMLAGWTLATLIAGTVDVASMK